MFTMRRKFNAVGQGAFYTEEFYNESNTDSCFTMVYDCGSYGNENLIKTKISTTLNISVDIDLLCISHFHADHINGLEYLLKNYNVKKILLPLLTEEEKMEVFLANNNASKFIQNFSLNPQKTINIYSSETKLIFISKFEENNNFIDITLKDLDHINSEEPIISGTPLGISISNKVWQYVPFNFEFKKRSKVLIEELKKIGINSGNFKSKYKTNKAKIIAIYKKIPADLNTNSMTLYSNCIPSKLGSIITDNINSLNEKTGCIYMGDYNAKGLRKWKKFKDAFNMYLPKVGTIQIPHHGSSRNYNEKLNSNTGIISIMSAGKTNKYRHPHGTTLRKIILNKGIPLIISEDISTEYIQKISIYT